MSNRLSKQQTIVSAVLFFCLGLAWQAGASRQPSGEIPERIDAYMAAQMKAYKIPGAAIAIVRDGKPAFVRGYGVANARGDAVTPDTPFLLASVSKSITALGVMQLAEAGRLRLDDPVRAYLPWISTAETGDPITVADLLYHSSGYTELAGVQATLKPDGPEALEAGVRDLAGASLQSGSDWEYSNLNYNTLGLLIEKVSGQSYEAYIEEHVFGPLGMQHSYTSQAAAQAGGAASGYYPFFGIPIVYDDWMPYSRATLPAAGLWSSASDLSSYMIAQLDGGRFKGAELLSEIGIDQLHRPGITFPSQGGYAMGWFYWPGFLDRKFQPEDGLNYTDLATLYHAGDWANYKAVLLLLPGLDFGLALLMNSNNLPIRSVFTYFAWDLTLIATGSQPLFLSADEAFFLQYSRWIGAALIGFLLLEMAFSLHILRKMRSPKYALHFSPARLLLFAGLPLLFDGALVGFYFWRLLPDHGVDLQIVIRNIPDLGILSVLVLGLALVWGPIRSLMYWTAWAKSRSEAHQPALI